MQVHGGFCDWKQVYVIYCLLFLRLLSFFKSGSVLVYFVPIC